MFITVRYGDGQEVLFNPNCRTNVLLQDIKRRCKRRREEVIDLSDEQGNLKYLADHPAGYATDLLKERELFVLIQVEKKEDEGLAYIPLLNDLNVVTTAFLEQLSKCESENSSVNSSSHKSISSVLPLAGKKPLAKARSAFMAGTATNNRLSSKTSRDRGVTRSPNLKRK